MGPSVLLSGNSAPVAGSVLTITPEAGEDKGIMERALAIPTFSELFNCTRLLETL
jgi:hypothetical protein